MKTHTYITIHRQLCMSKDVIPLKTGKSNCRKKKKKKTNRTIQIQSKKATRSEASWMDGGGSLSFFTPNTLLISFFFFESLVSDQTNPIQSDSNQTNAISGC